MNALVYDLARNEKRKKQLWDFAYLYKIWQILKRFAGIVHRAQTLKLRGVYLYILNTAKGARDFQNSPWMDRPILQYLYKYFSKLFYI